MRTKQSASILPQKFFAIRGPREQRAPGLERADAEPAATVSVGRRGGAGLHHIYRWSSFKLKSASKFFFQSILYCPLVTETTLPPAVIPQSLQPNVNVFKAANVCGLFNGADLTHFTVSKKI